uniref:Uncharacterized protein n=1 Tax=Sphaerodactylus townsendi TaxID=933632 RepID=A0ACB8F6Q0_9SAUR
MSDQSLDGRFSRRIMYFISMEERQGKNISKIEPKDVNFQDLGVGYCTSYSNSLLPVKYISIQVQNILYASIPGFSGFLIYGTKLCMFQPCVHSRDGNDVYQ